MAFRLPQLLFQLRLSFRSAAPPLLGLAAYNAAFCFGFPTICDVLTAAQAEIRAVGDSGHLLAVYGVGDSKQLASALLSKGQEELCDKFTSWINSGELIIPPGSLRIVDVLENQEAEWVTIENERPDELEFLSNTSLWLAASIESPVRMPQRLSRLVAQHLVKGSELPKVVIIDPAAASWARDQADIRIEDVDELVRHRF